MSEGVFVVLHVIPTVNTTVRGKIILIKRKSRYVVLRLDFLLAPKGQGNYYVDADTLLSTACEFLPSISL